MIDTFDVKTEGRVSDKILNLLNGMYDRKMTNVLGKNEFSEIIVNTGDLLANYIKQDKMSEEQIDSVETYLTQFLGEYSDKFFNYPHNDLKRAGKTALESIDLAKVQTLERKSYAEPVESNGYEKTFRKLGN